MKTWIAAGVWGFAMAASIAAATRDPNEDLSGETVATLAERVGSVQYRHEDFAIWDYVSKGHRFFGAEIVATGPESAAVVRFVDGRALELGAGAQVGLSLGQGGAAGGLVVTLLKGNLTVRAAQDADDGGKAPDLQVLSVRAGGRTVKVESTATVKLERQQGRDATSIEVVRGAAELVEAPGKPAVPLGSASPVVVEDAAKPARAPRVATYFQAAKANVDGTLTVQPKAAAKVETVTYTPPPAPERKLAAVARAKAAPVVDEAPRETPAPPLDTPTERPTETPVPAPDAVAVVPEPAARTEDETPPPKKRPRQKQVPSAPTLALATPEPEPTPAPVEPPVAAVAPEEPAAPAVPTPTAPLADEPAPELALAVTKEAEEPEDTGPALAERLSVPSFASGARYGVPLLSGALAENATYASAFLSTEVRGQDRVRARVELWPEARDDLDGIASELAAQRAEIGYGVGHRLSQVPLRLELMTKILTSRVSATLPATSPEGRREARSLDARFTGLGLGGGAELVWRRSLLTVEGGWVPPLKSLGLTLSGAHFSAEWQIALFTWSDAGALALAAFVASERTSVERGEDEATDGLRRVEFKQVFAGGGLNLSL